MEEKGTRLKGILRLGWGILLEKIAGEDCAPAALAPLWSCLSDFPKLYR
jgi:hypothetical protein